MPVLPLPSPPKSLLRAACSPLAALFLCAALFTVPPSPVLADMVDSLDLASDDFTKAEMTRADIEAALAAKA